MTRSLTLLFCCIQVTFLALPAVAQVDLFVATFPPPVVDAGLPFELVVTYANRGATDAHGVVLTVRGPAGPLTYTIGDLPGVGSNGIPDFKTLRLELTAPDESARTIPIRLQIKGDAEDAEASDNVHEAVTRTYRTYFVTNTDDGGSGSFRAAIETANGDCREAGFCKIAFRIAPGVPLIRLRHLLPSAEGRRLSNSLLPRRAGEKVPKADEGASPTWHTITPRSLLPVITAPNIRIDAAIQSRYVADMNPDGPEIELRGAIENGGHGLEAACGASVHGFAVNGFAGSGLHFSNGPCRPPDSARMNDTRSIERNYLGTDPTGNVAVPNFRGVTFESAGAWLLHENVISGNVRSGVYLENSQVQITNNIIGLNATHTYTAMPANSFQANGNLAIDYGLDGPTSEVPDAGGSTPVRRPVITAARYDAATDETIVEGTSDTQNERYEVWIYVYANDEPDPSGYGEGQYYLGNVKANDDRSFTFRYKGRPPGRWIAAATTRINIIGFLRTPGTDAISGSGFTSTTSEFGRTVEIQ